MIRTTDLRNHVAALFGALIVSTMLFAITTPVVPIV